MSKKLFLIGIVMMLGLSACSLPRLVKVDPTATPKPSQPTALPTTQDEPTAVAPTDVPPVENLPLLPAELADSVSIGESLISETFDENGSWNSSDDPEFGAEVVDGVYRMYLNTANWMLWSESGEVMHESVMMDLDVAFVSGSEENNQGMLCRYVDDENFYTLTVGSDAWVEIMKVYQDEQEPLFGEYMDSLVDPLENHLQGFCIGDRIILYVNGELAADVQDSDLTIGDVGLAIGTYDEPQVTIDFDNFFVYEVEGDFTETESPEKETGDTFSLNLVDEWTVSYSDDFDTPNNGRWTEFDGEDVLTQWQDGRFAFDAYATGITAISTTNELSLDDVVVQAEVYRMDDVLGNDMGLVCRYQDPDNYYSLSFGNDDYVAIYKTVDGNWESLFNEFLDIDLSAGYHKVAVSCIGTELSLYVDDQLLISVSDGDLSTGDVGLLAGTYEDVPIRLAFDNFVVYIPK